MVRSRLRTRSCQSLKYSKAPVRPASRRRTLTVNNRHEHIHNPIKSTDSAFASSKRDKRLIKHSAFLNKIQKQNIKLKKKRRRPSKKLVTTLESLADALPDAEQQATTEEARVSQEQENIRRKALKSRPGMQKRKERVDKAERERFSHNLAQMISSKAANPTEEAKSTQSTTNQSVDRWGVLREFIAQNMEKKT